MSPWGTSRRLRGQDPPLASQPHGQLPTLGTGKGSACAIDRTPAIVMASASASSAS